MTVVTDHGLPLPLQCSNRNGWAVVEGALTTWGVWFSISFTVWHRYSQVYGPVHFLGDGWTIQTLFKEQALHLSLDSTVFTSWWAFIFILTLHNLCIWKDRNQSLGVTLPHANFKSFLFIADGISLCMPVPHPPLHTLKLVWYLPVHNFISVGVMVIFYSIVGGSCQRAELQQI